LIAAVLASRWLLIIGPGILSSCPTAPGSAQYFVPASDVGKAFMMADTISGISAIVRDQVFCLFFLVAKLVVSCWLLCFRFFSAPVAGGVGSLLALRSLCRGNPCCFYLFVPRLRLGILLLLASCP